MKNKIAIFTAIFMMIVGSIFADLLSEDFTDGIPETWTVVNLDGDDKMFFSPGQYSINGDDKKHASAMGCSDDYLITPALSVTADNSELNFKAAIESINYPYGFEVMISSTGNEIEDFTVIPDQIYENYDIVSWDNGEHSVDLSAYEGSNVYVAFHVTSAGASNWNFAFDDISGPEIYFADYDFKLTELSEDKIIPGGSWDVYLTKIENKGLVEDTYNFSSVSSSGWTTSIWKADQSEEISSVSLSPGEEDSVIVKIEVPAEGVIDGYTDELTLNVTSAGDASLTKSADYVTTVIMPITNLPYEENFDSLEEGLPFGWRQDINPGSTGWILKSNNIYTNYAYSPEKCLYIWDGFSSEIDNKLFISPVALEAGTAYKFSAMMKNNSGVDGVSLQMGYGTEANYETMTVLADIDQYEGIEYNRVAAFVTPEESGNYVFFIRLVSNTGTWFVIDDLIVEEAFPNDLKVIDLSYEENVYFEGNPIMLHAEIYNNGGEVQSNSVISFKYEENVIGTATIPEISPGATETVDFEWTAVPGLSGNLTASVPNDDNNSNNSASVSIDVYQNGWLAESFENEFPPLEWSNILIENNVWEKYYNTDSPQGENCAALKAVYEYGSYNPGKARLVTPKLIINSESEISFYAAHFDSTDYLKLEYSEDKENFTEIQEIMLTENMQKYTVSLADLPEGNYYLAFNGETGTGWNWEIMLDMVTGPQIYLSENAVFELTPDIQDLNFGSQDLDAEPQIQDFIVRNAGSSSMEINESDLVLSGENSDQFSLVFDENQTFPVSLNCNETLNFSVKFIPTSLGIKNALLTIEDNIGRSSHAVDLNGLATPAYPSLLSPANDSINVPVNQTLTWLNGAETEFIDLYLDTVNPPLTKVLDRVSPVEAFETELQNATSYYWKVVNYATVEDSEYTRESQTGNFETALSENILQIGNGNLTDKDLPMAPYYIFSYSQSIYLQSEINQSNKLIEKIYYHFNGEHDFSDEITVYMGHTEKTEFTSENDWIPGSMMTQVYSGTFPLQANDGWYEIDLDQPFVYNNIDNLVIAFDENTESYHYSSDDFYCTSVENNRSIHYKSDSYNVNPEIPDMPEVPGIPSQFIPNIRLQCLDLTSNPAFNVDPATVYFNSVELGETENRTVTISNVGGGSLVINNILLVNDEENSFSFTPEFSESITIPANESFEITMSFFPQTLGEKVAQLTIIDNLDRSEHIVEISGSGTEETPAPTSLTATIENNNNVNLSWTAPALNASVTRTRNVRNQAERLLQGYNIYRNTVKINDIPITETDFLDQSLAQGNYVYAVKAVYVSGESEESNTASVEIIIDQINPPVGLSAEVTEYDVTLSWQEPRVEKDFILRNERNIARKFEDRDFVGYKVYRNNILLNPFDFVTELYYEDNNVDPGIYEYYVIAVFSSGSSDPSELLNVEVDALIPPDNLTGYVENNQDVNLTWEYSESRALIKFEVWRDNEKIAETNPGETNYSDTPEEEGTLVYFVKAIYPNGESEPSNECEVLISSAEENPVYATELKGNSPNPFNPETVISFTLGRDDVANACLEIFNSKGQKIRSYLSDTMQAGENKLVWKGCDETGNKVSSGVYFYLLKAGETIESGKMLLLK
ncbi:MAG: hypothetical protein CSB55_00380 [Candidatus Cloacimonadota bacterium]|nr:MAG: hypothetical protein CSB55_00380 [Candidatus Cloacimonadota bacterium]